MDRFCEIKLTSFFKKCFKKWKGKILNLLDQHYFPNELENN